jgi:hypothetical protein
MNTNKQPEAKGVPTPMQIKRGTGTSMKQQFRIAGALLAFYVAMSLSVGALLHFAGAAEMETAVAAQTIMPCPGEGITEQASQKE